MFNTSDRSLALSDSDAAAIDSLNVLFAEMFTKNNLETDEFMLANMQPNMMFPLEVICRNQRVRNITTNEALIEKALSFSQNVEVVDRMIRPRIKVEQHTIILRDISLDSPPGDVLKIFEEAAPDADGKPCPHATSAHGDMNNTWFVSFASEADARQALICVRTSRFGGAPVKARLKTESLNKSFYSGGGAHVAFGGQMTPGISPSPSSPVMSEYFPMGAPVMPYFPYALPSPGYISPGQIFPQMSPMGWQMTPTSGPMSGGRMVPGMFNSQQRPNNRTQSGMAPPTPQHLQQQQQQPRNNYKQRQSPKANSGGRYPQSVDANQNSVNVYPSDVQTLNVEAEATIQNDKRDVSPEHVEVTLSTVDGDVVKNSVGNRKQNDRKKQTNNNAPQSNSAAQVATANKKREKVSQNASSDSQRRKSPEDTTSGHNSGKLFNEEGLGNQRGNSSVIKKKGGKTGEQSQKSAPNFNLNVADFPVWANSGDKGGLGEEKGGDKGSWAAALIGSSKSNVELPNTRDRNDKKKVVHIDSSAEPHSILLNPTHHSHSFGKDVHISFVPDTSDVPNHIHRIPTPIPSDEEILDRVNAPVDASPPPPLHVNDSSRDKLRTHSGTFNDIDTLVFGTFSTPVDINSDKSTTCLDGHNGSTNGHAVHSDLTAAVNGKRSFMDVLKAKK